MKSKTLIITFAFTSEYLMRGRVAVCIYKSSIVKNMFYINGQWNHGAFETLYISYAFNRFIG